MKTHEMEVIKMLISQIEVHDPEEENLALEIGISALELMAMHIDVVEAKLFVWIFDAIHIREHNWPERVAMWVDLAIAARVMKNYMERSRMHENQCD